MWYKHLVGCSVCKLVNLENTTIADINMRKCSSKANKLGYINTIRGTPRDIATKDRKLIKSKSKSSRFSHIEIIPLLGDKLKSKNGDLVSEKQCFV